jgi:hypothetical protein
VRKLRGRGLADRYGRSRSYPVPPQAAHTIAALLALREHVICPIPAHGRVRQDTIDTGGSITLRYRSKLYHIGVGRRHAGTKVTILAAGLNIRILTPDGTLLRQLTLDPARNYQPQRLPASP